MIPLDRLQSLATGRMIEPVGAYQVRDVGGLAHWHSSDEIDPAALADTLVVGVGNSLITGYRCQLVGSKRIRIVGNDNTVFVGASARIASLDLEIVGNRCIVYVGAFTTAGGFRVRMFGDEVSYSVGDRCMFAAGATLGCQSVPIYSRRTQEKLVSRDIVIDDHVWLAREVRVLPGATIGRDSVVGQWSQVEGSFGEGSVIAGQPARVIAEDVTWGRTTHATLADLQASSHYRQTYQQPLERLEARIAALTAGAG